MNLPDSSVKSVVKLNAGPPGMTNLWNPPRGAPAESAGTIAGNPKRGVVRWFGFGWTAGMSSPLDSLPPTPPSFNAPLVNLPRRHFLRQCALVVAATGLPAWFVEQQMARAAEAATPARRLSANDRPGVAVVGTGGMGRADMGNAANFGDIVALCDVDSAHAEQAAQVLAESGNTHRPELLSDFRELLTRKDVDVIINATPDHWHTLVNLAAARAGKDVYSEKPLTLTVDEGRRVVEAVKAGGIVLQTGTQQRSSQRFRLAVELVRNARLGALKHVTVWLPAGLRGGPFKASSAPSTLNWDYWLGQAPKERFVTERCHSNFRFWYDYSGGTMTDWGAHHMDIAGWAIGLDAPERIEAEVFAKPVRGGYTAFSDYAVRYAYANGVTLDVRTTPADSIYGEVKDPDGQRNGIRFEGTEGWLWVNRSQLKASDPEILRTPLGELPERLPASSDHMGNFFDCVRSRELPICHAEVGHRSATVCHLGAIALRTGRALTWDAAAEQFVGPHARRANRYLAREMRRPYDYGFGA